jgi:hypothetical protein
MRIFRHKREKWQEAGEDCIMGSFITCTFHQILRVNKSRGVRWAGNIACMDMRNGCKFLVRNP